MKTLPLLLLPVCCLLSSCGQSRPSPDVNAILCQEAFKPSWGGPGGKEFTYHGRQLIVIIRSHTSGVASSEPFILLKTEAGSTCLFHAATVPFEMEATIEQDRLVLWRQEWPEHKLQRSEFMSYDLRTLPTTP